MNSHLIVDFKEFSQPFGGGAMMSGSTPVCFIGPFESVYEAEETLKKGGWVLKNGEWKHPNLPQHHFSVLTLFTPENFAKSHLH